MQRVGHLTVFRSGYFVFGAGNPAAYGIDDYRERDATDRQTIRCCSRDPRDHADTVAGRHRRQLLAASNDAAKTFLGIGVVPSDRDRMRQWNEYGAGRVTCRIPGSPTMRRHAD